MSKKLKDMTPEQKKARLVSVRRWRSKNKEKVCARRRNPLTSEGKEAARETARRYRARPEIREKERLKNKIWYQKNREKILPVCREKAKEYYHKNKEAIAIKYRARYASLPIEKKEARRKQAAEKQRMAQKKPLTPEKRAKRAKYNAEYNRLRRITHRLQINEKNRRWNALHREEIRAKATAKNHAAISQRRIEQAYGLQTKLTHQDYHTSGGNGAKK